VLVCAKGRRLLTKQHNQGLHQASGLAWQEGTVAASGWSAANHGVLTTNARLPRSALLPGFDLVVQLLGALGFLLQRQALVLFQAHEIDQ
jgi:hypothetical protein